MKHDSFEPVTSCTSACKLCYSSLNTLFIFPIKYPALMSKQLNVFFPVKNSVWKDKWKPSERMKQHLKKRWRMGFLYAPRLLSRLTFDKTDRQKETFTRLHSVQTLLRLPGRSRICKDATEWLIPPACLPGSRSVSSVMRLTWTDDTQSSLSAPLCLSHSVWTYAPAHLQAAPKLTGNLTWTGRTCHWLLQEKKHTWLGIICSIHFNPRALWESVLEFNLVHMHRSHSGRDAWD